ncbi:MULTISPECIES: signal peptide peptidase SppA [Enterococcus]|uniref:Signal peptide peptidase SppA, 36K type n=1 Tax=Enterococcus diestrammenae TaxID=1155073 RepID=A0ABV0F293_9ENTE|nr:signal peptide peptidase SppA [Enterococcus diestrammenae]KAF1299921.1 signal peptidase [Enterococcus diestrammenae]
MNRRRWVALAIAAGLFFVAGLTQGVQKPQKQEETTETLKGINQWLYGSNELGKTVLTDGDESEQILRLSVEGTIADGGSGGLFSSAGYDHQLFLEELQAAQEDDHIKGILLEVNSPGGGVYESAEIAKELAKIKELGIPLYVSMKQMAASGGYYISAAADKIFATDETVTGSIGVIMSGTNYAGLFEKLGIEDTTIKSGALKDIGSSTRQPTAEDKKVLQAYVDNAFGRFVKVVAQGRGMSEEKVRKIADGRIYDGSQALENGLVDAIGFPDDALAALQKEQDLEDAQVVEYTTDTTGFASSWFGMKLAEAQGLRQSDSNRMLQLVESLGTPASPKPLYYYGGE